MKYEYCNIALTMEDYRQVMEAVYSNDYYTNHGPLARELECALEKHLFSANAVCMYSDALALLVALTGLKISGNVVVADFGSVIPVKAALWAGLEVKIADVDRDTHMLSIDTLDAVIETNTEAVIITELWGNKIGSDVIDYLLSKSMAIIIYSDSLYKNNATRNDFENIIYVYPFFINARDSSSDGGCIATSNNELAEVFRNLRSSYGSRRTIDGLATLNGRFSEIQAGLVSKYLSRIDDLSKINSMIYKAYKKMISRIDDIELYTIPENVISNYQYITINNFSHNSTYHMSKLDRIFAEYGNILLSDRKLCIHDMPYFKKENIDNNFPVSTELNKSVMPFYMNSNISDDVLELSIDDVN